MLLGRVVTTLDGLFEAPICVHLLIDLVMIYQTAQCWSSDGLFERFEVGERKFDFFDIRK
jgi:hypothetical protein